MMTEKLGGLQWWFLDTGPLQRQDKTLIVLKYKYLIVLIKN